MRRPGAYILFAALLIALMQCRVDPKIGLPVPAQQEAYREIIPEGWPKPVYDFRNNPVSKEKFELGRALFFEPMLSSDNSVSCGSCHQPFAAFANADHRVSHGVNDREGNRNSPPIFNLTWHPSFMHDGGVNHIEVQPLAPISNPVEMDEDINTIFKKLAASARYRKLFKDAYGTEEVNTERMMKSMAQFMALLYSFNSRFDQYRRGEGNVQLSDTEKRGYTLFTANCSSCHKEPLFSDFAFRSNGLRVNPAVNDSGRGRITHDPADVYKFKTPSLRNIAKTAPYMHDGSIATLEACIDHYTLPPQNKRNLDPLLADGPMQLSTQDKKDLVAFLHTLTDFEFLQDPRFAEPASPK